MTAYSIPCADCGTDTKWPKGQTPTGTVRCTTCGFRAYRKATAKEARHRQYADQASAERSYELATMHTSGMSYGQIAKTCGLSRSRVQQLVERSVELMTEAEAIGNPDQT